MKNRITAPKNGPPYTVRFRSKAEFALVKRAARLEGLSLNTFVVGRASAEAAEVIKNNAAIEAAEAACSESSS